MLARIVRASKGGWYDPVAQKLPERAADELRNGGYLVSDKGNEVALFETSGDGARFRAAPGLLEALGDDAVRALEADKRGLVELE